MSLKIDVFNHIFPKPFFERLQDVIVNRGAVKRWLHIPVPPRSRRALPDARGVRRRLPPGAVAVGAADRVDQSGSRRSRSTSRGWPTIRWRTSCARIPERFPGFIASLPLNYPDESVRGARTRRERSRRARRAGVLERQRPAARRRTLLPAVRNGGPAALSDLPASGARRHVCRLRQRDKIEVRDLVDVRLAVRDERRHAAARVLASLRSTARHQDRGAPSRRDDSVLRGSCRLRPRPVRHAHRR